ncbi:spore germination protein [Ureibacillus sinduriensis]|uniref:Spore gernimation protein GerA n=1 Tax=Ureibacillus sinduriensis BLB-1 = JCM 15800 TaxID=1384057 RepID=A0A0A3I7T0_9BACL|nr:spore germination protein [Ureibacillus sinduriensis]KGR78773.1 spore gernimation protein GerA [Ureibacillus sinduriensis BLB-1 = JCM 15800]
MSSMETIKWINEQLKPTNEFIQKNLDYENKHILLFYLKSVVDSDMLQNLIITPFFDMKSEEQLRLYVQALPQFQEVQSKEQIRQELLNGNVLAFIQDELYLLDFRLSNNDKVNQTNVETTIHGSQLALSDNLMTNINLIRTNYHQSSLSIEYLDKGEVNQQKVAIIYDQEKVKSDVLDIIRTRLQKVDKQVITSTTQLNNYLNDKKFSLFPQMIMTERPDRIIYNLAGGKVVLLVDGNPQAVATPVVFFDFMTTMEDNYHTVLISFFLRILRYAGLILSLLLPSLYVGATSYTPEVFRTELALTVAGSRVGVPFSSFIEVLFMLFFMELLLEASIRLPKAVSATATTVGGLILGTAVTEASLASNIMVIIVSAVAISTFVIPVNEMAFSIRVLRLLLILVTSLFGLAGLVLGFFALIMYLVNLDSFGEPYLKLYTVSKNKKRSEGKA